MERLSFKVVRMYAAHHLQYQSPLSVAQVGTGNTLLESEVKAVIRDMCEQDFFREKSCIKLSKQQKSTGSVNACGLMAEKHTHTHTHTHTQVKSPPSGPCAI